jgi:hypothetical protein
MKLFLLALQRCVDDGGGVELPKAVPLLFLVRNTSAAAHSRRIALRLSRKRWEGLAWLVGLGLLILVFPNISGIVTATS